VAQLIVPLSFRLLVLLITLLFIPQISFAEIGKINTLEGPVVSIKRNKNLLEGNKDSDIESMDTVETKNSTVNISFKDDTKVTIKENSRLLIDDFVYNANASGGKLGLKIGFGTVRYASGQIAHSNPQSVDIQTPTATIGVRGTDFNMVVDEIGRSLVVLVPSCDGTRCVTGKIEVTSLSGTVVLDQPYTATYVSQASQAPIQPVKIANVTDKQINNLLIIAVPREVMSEMHREGDERQRRNEMDQMDKHQMSGPGKALSNRHSPSPVIIVENKNGTIGAKTSNDVNNGMFIDFGTSGNASITLIRNADINTAKVGDGGSSKITIRQTK
jgi:FecR protein